MVRYKRLMEKDDGEGSSRAWTKKCNDYHRGSLGDGR